MKYEVIRKHPNKTAKHALTVGTRKLATGEVFSLQAIARALLTEVDAKLWIEQALKRGWIKALKEKGQAKKKGASDENKD